jgi:hypothetical protein
MLDMKSSFVGLAVLCLCFSAGCGGAVDEIPPGGGGPSPPSPEEIKKQMDESMKKSGGKYKGSLPGETK